MYLDRLLALNAGLAISAVRLHQGGELRANTYLLDIDAFAANTREIRRAADEHGLSVYFMSKQFGRNPDACRAIASAGVDAAVAVDLQCMEALERSDTRIGHVGHLVQPNRWTEDGVISAKPEVVTVYALEIAQRLGAAAIRAGRLQPVLLRVVGPGDNFYFGHGGGFALETIEQSARIVDAIPGLRVAGVTTFPCLLADGVKRTIEPTHNFDTLRRAAERLRAAGFEINQVNAPGTTSAKTMKTLADGGATHVEPGNAFHGTTPLHLFDATAPEVPAMVYVSEVSHFDGGDAYVYGAGLYIDKLLGDYQLRAICGRDEGIVERVVPAEMAADGAIHYYCKLHLPANHDVRIGDTVVFCFRPQSFVTRGRTQAVFGVRSGDPKAGTTFDIEARPVEGIS
jgi:predicted amino acid racemase